MLEVICFWSFPLRDLVNPPYRLDELKLGFQLLATKSILPDTTSDIRSVITPQILLK